MERTELIRSRRRHNVKMHSFRPHIKKYANKPPPLSKWMMLNIQWININPGGLLQAKNIFWFISKNKQFIFYNIYIFARYTLYIPLDLVTFSPKVLKWCKIFSTYTCSQNWFWFCIFSIQFSVFLIKEFFLIMTIWFDLSCLIKIKDNRVWKCI